MIIRSVVKGLACVFSPACRITFKLDLTFTWRHVGQTAEHSFIQAGSLIDFISDDLKDSSSSQTLDPGTVTLFWARKSNNSRG